MKRKRLVIISHTEHYIDKGIVKGWGSTVNEVNFLADYWEEVVHVACLHKCKAPLSSLPYNRKNISFVPLPAYGGTSIFKKIEILFKMPIILYKVKRSIKGATEVQLRTPTAMGLFLLPLFTWFWKRDYQFWVKFAGDWEQERPPRANGWQRWFLQKKWVNFPVTINGIWPNQQGHCHSFENPCLTKEHLNEGKLIVQNRVFTPPFNFIFVGRIDEVKGLDRILEALSNQPKNLIKELIIIGDGPKRMKYEKMAKDLNVQAQFKGFLKSELVHDYLKKTDFILLPSSNEGFPKVIAEAACYGVIPVVSNVSSIKHYLNNNNGFVWDINGEITYSEVLHETLTSPIPVLMYKSIEIVSIAKLFTFEAYINKLNNHILESDY